MPIHGFKGQTANWVYCCAQCARRMARRDPFRRRDGRAVRDPASS